MRRSRAPWAAAGLVLLGGCFDFDALLNDGPDAGPSDAGRDAPWDAPRDAPADAPHDASQDAAADAAADAEPAGCTLVPACEQRGDTQWWVRCSGAAELLETPCPLGCDETTHACRTFRPTHWSEQDKTQLLAGTRSVVVPGDTGTYRRWIIDTTSVGSPPIVRECTSVSVSGESASCVNERVLALEHTEMVLADGAQPALALLFRNFTVSSGALVYVTGDRPLVFVAAEEITIEGIVEAGGGALGFYSNGPGSVSMGSCVGGEGSTDDVSLEASGSGGGSYGRGTGNNAAGHAGGMSSSGQPGGAAGTPVGNMPVTLRGGCAGGLNFHRVNGAWEALRRAPGGGAVALVALGAVRLKDGARVTAGGAGGPNDGGERAGGRGGGSGGYVLVEAPLVELSVGAQLAVMGGGGGPATLCDSGCVGESGQRGAVQNSSALGGRARHPTMGLLDAVARGGRGQHRNGSRAERGENGTTDVTHGFKSSAGGGGGGAGFVMIYHGEHVTPGTPQFYPNRQADPANSVVHVIPRVDLTPPVP